MTVGSGRNAFTELIVTIDPPPAASIGPSTARVARTAAIRPRFRVASHCSSVTAKKPSIRGETAPTLLTRMSTGPSSSPAATSAAGPSGVDRSTATGTTPPSAASASSSGLLDRAPATTRTPSRTSVRVTARPMPLLAPVTTAIRPASPSSMARAPLQPVAEQPGERRLRDVLPAAVDRQRVTAALELAQLGDGRRVAVLLERRARHDVGHGVVGGAGDQQQRAPVGVLGVDGGLGVHDEVGGGGLEQGPGRGRDGPLLVE